MTKTLAGTVALVTGASSGIGAATAANAAAAPTVESPYRMFAPSGGPP